MSGTLIDNASAAWVVNGVNSVLQTDAVEGQATGASHGGIGNSNAAAQVLANRTAFLYGRQNTDQANIATLQAQVAFLLTRWTNRQVFGTAGTFTFTVPAGVTSVRATTVGGGGGGAGAYNGGAWVQNSGGAAGAGVQGIYSVTAGQKVTVKVGQGGAGGATDSAGAPGGASSFGSFCTANGGEGGTYDSTTTAFGGQGTGGTSDTIIVGGPGGLNSNNTSSIPGGKGGDAPFGLGFGGAPSLGAGSAGVGYGAGGASFGADVGGTGGTGTNGIVIVEW